jgi:hypothetical protein
MYTAQQKSIPQIASELTLPRSRVRNALLYGGVKPRDRLAAIKLAKKSGRYAQRPTPARRCWGGGKRRNESGYVQVWQADSKNYIFEHRIVWEAAHGPLPRGWTVHHINGVKDDNRLENLLALPKKSHAKIWQFVQYRIQQLEQEVAELKTDVEALRRQLKRTRTS